MTSIRILIVDDMAQVRHDLRTLLPLAGQAAGLQLEIVGEAGNGQEAIQQTTALSPDVTLMDLEMPVMDGYEAARQQALQAGADGFIVKGAPVETLVQAISERKE